MSSRNKSPVEKRNPVGNHVHIDKPEESLIGPVSDVEVTDSGRKGTVLLDTGSQVSTITDEFVAKHPLLRSQKLQHTSVSIQGAGGQPVPHSGFIRVDLNVLGQPMQKVPVFVVPATEFQRRVPGLLGTNVLRACRDALHDQHGRGFLQKVQRASEVWYSALQYMNANSADLMKRNGVSDSLMYKGRKPFIVKAGSEADIPTKAPRVTQGRTFEALLESVDKAPGRGSLAIGNTFVEVRNGKVPVWVFNLSTRDVVVRRNTHLDTLVMGREVLAGPRSSLEGMENVPKVHRHESSACEPLVSGFDVDLDALSRE